MAYRIREENPSVQSNTRTEFVRKEQRRHETPRLPMLEGKHAND